MIELISNILPRLKEMSIIAEAGEDENLHSSIMHMGSLIKEGIWILKNFSHDLDRLSASDMIELLRVCV